MNISFLSQLLEFWSDLTWWSWTEISSEAGAAVSSEGLTGAGGPPAKMAQTHCWQAGAGCWQEATFSGGPLLRASWMSSQYGSWPPLEWVIHESKVEAATSSMTQVHKSPTIISAIFCLSHKLALVRCGRILHRTWAPGGKGIGGRGASWKRTTSRSMPQPIFRL